MNTKFIMPKILALYLPMLIGMACISTGRNMGIANLMIGLSFALLFGVHALLALGFCRRIPDPSIIYKVNTVIPALFFSLYFIYLIWCWFTIPVSPQHPHGTIRIAKTGMNGQVIFAFMIHALVSFIFITNQYVSARIKRMTDPDQQATLRDNYLTPMRRIVRTGGWIAGCFLALTLLLDIIVLFTGG